MLFHNLAPTECGEFAPMMDINWVGERHPMFLRL